MTAITVSFGTRRPDQFVVADVDLASRPDAFAFRDRVAGEAQRRTLATASRTFLAAFEGAKSNLSEDRT